MTKDEFFATAALMIGAPPTDRRGMATGTLVGSKSSPTFGGAVSPLIAKFGFGVQLLTLWEQMGRPGEDDKWRFLASYDLTSNERKDLSEIIYKEYAKWYETEQRIRQAAEAL